MADNKRWFKVWTAILIDQHMMTLSMEDRGRWMTLGALIAHNGTSGKLAIKRGLLAHLLHIENVTKLSEKINCLPNVKIINSCNDTCEVTFEKWHKYQVDDSALRVTKYRENVTMQEENKKRREKEEKKNKKKNKESSPEALRLSGLLADLILKNDPEYRSLNKKKDETVSRWAADIDKLLRIDKQSADEIEAVIRWCQGDDFWAANILSGKKLREKWDTLKAHKQRPQGRVAYL